MRNKWKGIFTVLTFAISIMGTTEAYATVTSPLFNEYQGMIFYNRDEGVYVYQTRDVQRISSTYYHTLGLELSRINRGVNPFETNYNNNIFNPMAEGDPHYYVDASTTNLNPGWTYNGMQREYVLINLDDAELGVDEYKYTNSSGDEIIVTSYTFTEEYLFEKLDEYPEWKAELLEQRAAGENVYVGVDCVITMFRNGIQQGWIQ